MDEVALKQRLIHVGREQVLLGVGMHVGESSNECVSLCNLKFIITFQCRSYSGLTRLTSGNPAVPKMGGHL